MIHHVVSGPLLLHFRLQYSGINLRPYNSLPKQCCPETFYEMWSPPLFFKKAFLQTPHNKIICFLLY